MKQTAVEWLIEKLPTIDKYDPYYANIITQAKEMEKQQIIDATIYGDRFEGCYGLDSEQYYQETYKQD